MGPKGQARLSEIFEMLAKCAGGKAIRRESTHSNLITYGGKTYALPRGSKKEHDPHIQRNPVKRMAELFQLDPDCVNSFFEGMMRKPENPPGQN